VTDKKNLL